MRTDETTEYTAENAEVTDTPRVATEDADAAQDVTTSWPTRRSKKYSLADRERVYVITLLSMTVGLLLLAAVLFFCTKTVWYRAETDLPSGGDVPSGGVLDAEGDYPYADGPEVNGQTAVALVPFADNVSVIHQTVDLQSGHVALLDVEAGKIIASSHADEKMYPASMTKVMTLIVIAEHLPNAESLGEYITLSTEVVKDMGKEGASIYGFKAGQQVTVEALIYALMLESDGVAAVELAKYVAGSEAAFVELMNQKAAAMGLTNSHFANAVGLQDENNYSTARDIASIMNYAMQMSLCRQVMSTVSYRATIVDTDGISFPGTFFHSVLRDRLEGKPENMPSKVTITAGKTGYAGKESGYCLVTYAVTAGGKPYICVTAEAKTSDGCIADYLAVYNGFAKP